ncbi:(NiFe) hydrogenase maturation protein HypF [Chloroherpeton thalassium ATCC 35110]|uniref:Carbamoyltransferase n=1 Tax=Chloroherpeton thalassium (strain ATCC 35110 / GB-78) TaxID=517418 RepID=B3QYI7_CHLT3|nr:carbamoyltransferase HypF [Chloroherpeton thalassium]ACF13615.1 (NiFe) hydrogenase maturation protein HypF [Chloroherpeton thalassium ATCC 35110]
MAHGQSERERASIAPPAVALTAEKNERRKVLVKGIVQGVGFRPFVYNLAESKGLSGFVTNSAAGVEIEVEGKSAELSAFLRELENFAPPLASITEMRVEKIPAKGASGFKILASKQGEKIATLISPDVALCGDCLKELLDPSDRRYRYPFINCTNCGPRYTIIDNIPYDRPNTSMKHFPLCSDCDREYHAPENRRFHAQPNACPDCGPKLSLHKPDRSEILTADPISEIVRLLKLGHIVAIKGLGGFHLACDAENDEAVKRLRARKHRDEKPLAVMVQDLSSAQKFCQISDEEARALCSAQSPILLLKKNGTGLPESIAPGNSQLGILLPYTPVHHLLMQSQLQAAVMTSANLSDEPIAIDNDEAFERLGQIADYFLIHNREIYLRCDDSVAAFWAGKLRLIRRSRGYAPRPILVQSKGETVLAVGGELKNTVCLLKENQAFLSQHIGDLENLDAYNHFQKTSAHLQRIFEAKPELLVHDLHPGYLSSHWVSEQPEMASLAVQHHHAHMAACIAEHRLQGEVIGFTMDGTGYGTDGTIWGGEVFIGNECHAVRFASFEPMPLPGGDAAIKAPWRTGISYLMKSFDGKLPELPFLPEHNTEMVCDMVRRKFNSPLTSSAGRFFDAVASICGEKKSVRYEGQAAIEFMQKADGLDVPPFEIDFGKVGHVRLMMIQPVIVSLVKAIREGESASRLSSRFHKTLVAYFTAMANEARSETGIKTVVLSGGVFQNYILLEGLVSALLKQGFEVFSHEQVPTNDGGISLGQALIGRAYLKGDYRGITT